MADTSQANAVAGDVIFVDQNGDGVINNEDKVVVATTLILPTALRRVRSTKTLT